jgi:hypothetical protein
VSAVACAEDVYGDVENTRERLVLKCRRLNMLADGPQWDDELFDALADIGQFNRLFPERAIGQTEVGWVTIAA